MTMQQGEILNKETIDLLRSLEDPSEPSFLAEIHQMFKSRTPMTIQKMVDCFRSGEFSELRSHAHQLKGSAMQIGATALSQICGQLEQSNDACLTASGSELFSRLEKCAAETYSKLDEEFLQ